MSRRRKRRAMIVEIVLQRVEHLFDEASKEFHTHAQRSDRYVDLVRRLTTKYRVPLGKQYKMRFCRSCGAYLVYGVNARVRIKGKRTVVTCLRCNDLRRY
jgi:ribonuclease P protein subunit RPR2